MFLSFEFRTLLPIGCLAALCLAPGHRAQAIQPAASGDSGKLEIKAGVTTPTRSSVHGQWIDSARLARSPDARASAMARLQAEVGVGAWTRFDADTSVLDTLIPVGVTVPGASHRPEAAAEFATQFLGRHLELLAPGSHVADFELVSDVRTGDVRSVGFVQRHAGTPILGAQLSFRFKADRLIAVRSQAIPHVSATLATRTTDADPERARSLASAWIADTFAAGRVDLVHAGSTIDGPWILPLVRPGGVEVREVLAVEVELDAPRGRWRVFVDAATGEPLARRSLLRWAQLEFDVYQRSPLGPRTTLPAGFLEVDVGGSPAVTDGQGSVAVPGPQTPVGFGTNGLYIRVIDEAGQLASANPSLGPGSVFTWSLPDPQTSDAQLNAYAHAQLVKNRVLAIDPNFDVPLTETAVTVNIDDVCNAFADGDTINFFQTGSGCENTALVADVVYHEYGHVAHTQGLIPGVGLFDGALSEGMSDYLSATIVDDASVGRGFFLDTDDPIRELDPPDYEWRWPEDQGEVHDEGRIIGGAMWDLRVLMIAKHGVAEGVARTDRIWLEGLRRSVDIPSMYLEALVTNDDDGDLQNGTPDICEINEAFAAHGLYDPPEGALTLETEVEADGVRVRLDHGTPFVECGDIDPSATLRYRVRPSADLPDPTVTEVAMTAVGASTYEAVIPSQPDYTVIDYQVELDWGNGTQAVRPGNDGAPWYEVFFGEVETIWCADFEPGVDEGWSLGEAWQVGAPEGGSGDANAAWSGSGVAGVALGWPGTYPTWTTTSMIGPTIDASGFERVRLQYRRWLTVEDAFYDQAQITANGAVAWQNYASAIDFLASVHHRDREWVFHDVELTDWLAEDGTVQLGFAMSTDGGLEFGGWNIDGLCIVGHGEGSAGELCGDGIVGPYEECDDGNTQSGDGCSSGCYLEEDDEPDTGEADTGETGDLAAWDPGGRGCGCSTDGGRPATGGFGALALLGLLALRRERRRT